MANKVYTHDLLCENCSKIIWLVIPAGLRVEQYLEQNPLCTECGCKLIKGDKE